MDCPKCRENTLSKIQFIKSKKKAYLCDACNTFWFGDEHIDINTGHSLSDSRDDQHADTSFVFIDENTTDQQQMADEMEREEYELC